MLTVTASILETIIVRTSVFAGQQLLNVVYYVVLHYIIGIILH